MGASESKRIKRLEIAATAHNNLIDFPRFIGRLKDGHRDEIDRGTEAQINAVSLGQPLWYAANRLTWIDG